MFDKELVRHLGSRFIARKDVKAFQSDDGAWFPDRTPYVMQDFRDHLSGAKTLGHYMLDTESNCKLFALDIDLVKHSPECAERTCKGCPVTIPNLVISEDGNPVESGASHYVLAREAFTSGDNEDVVRSLRIYLRCLAQGLAHRIHSQLDIPVAIATSGHKGLHVYGFTGLMPAEACKQIAISILQGFNFEAFRGDNFWRHKFEYQMLEVEVFPKQGSLDGKDLGNLMKIPLGIHRVTKQRAEFINTKATLDRFVTMDPHNALTGDLPWE